MITSPENIDNGWVYFPYNELRDDVSMSDYLLAMELDDWLDPSLPSNLPINHSHLSRTYP